MLILSIIAPNFCATTLFYFIGFDAYILVHKPKLIFDADFLDAIIFFATIRRPKKIN